MEKVRAVKPAGLALLVTSCQDRQARLAATLRSIGIDFHCVRQCRAARALLRPELSVDVVITDITLEDSNWCDVLRAVVDSTARASVVVIAPSSADETLWSEVLWRGAHDILVEPFTTSEAQRIIESALRTTDRRVRRAVAGQGTEGLQTHHHPAQ